MPNQELRRQRTAMLRGFARATLVWTVVAVLALIAVGQARRAYRESDRANRLLP